MTYPSFRKLQDQDHFEIICIISETEMITVRNDFVKMLGPVTGNRIVLDRVLETYTESTQEEFTENFLEVFACIREAVIRNELFTNMTLTRWK